MQTCGLRFLAKQSLLSDESRLGGWHEVDHTVRSGLMVSVKRYLWLIHFVLIAAGVYIGADLFWAIVAHVSNWQPSSNCPFLDCGGTSGETDLPTICRDPGT